MTSPFATVERPDFVIDGCELVGGGMCPEQYDVYHGGVQIGYLRLRHGQFRADYPDVGGETVYRAHPKGDGWFEDDEREHFLKQAVAALKAHRSLYE